MGVWRCFGGGWSCGVNKLQEVPLERGQDWLLFNGPWSLVSPLDELRLRIRLSQVERRQTSGGAATGCRCTSSAPPEATIAKRSGALGRAAFQGSTLQDRGSFRRVERSGMEITKKTREFDRATPKENPTDARELTGGVSSLYPQALHKQHRTASYEAHTERSRDNSLQLYIDYGCSDGT